MPEIPVPDSKYISATVLLMDSNDVQFCFGTVFRPRHVITTASCVYNYSRHASFRGMYVLVEANFYPEYGIRHNVENIKCSNYYEHADIDIRMLNDIAVIIVSMTQHSKNSELLSKTKSVKN